MRERAEGEGFAVWLVQARQKGNTEDPFNASEQDSFANYAGESVITK